MCVCLCVVRSERHFLGWALVEVVRQALATSEPAVIKQAVCT